MICQQKMQITATQTTQRTHRTRLAIALWMVLTTERKHQMLLRITHRTILKTAQTTADNTLS